MPQLPEKHPPIPVRQIEEVYKKLSNTRILKALLVSAGLFYLLLSIYPKHEDFYLIAFISSAFDLHGSSFIDYVVPEYTHTIEYTPTYFILQGAWLKIGSLLLSFDLNSFILDRQNHLNPWMPGTPVPLAGTFWGMLPNLACLFLLVALSYYALKDKWLALLGFGSFTLVSVIVMGQIDIVPVLLIFVSMVLLLKASGHRHCLSLVLLSFLALGASLQFKTYGGILLPVYCLYTLSLLTKRNVSPPKAITAVAALAITAASMYFVPWIPFWKWLGYTISVSESQWLFNLQLSPTGLAPYHTISIWLIGYGIILYAYFRDLNKTQNTTSPKRLIYYCFAVTAWFFIAVNSQSQWWILLLPPILLVLDNFRSKLNYAFCIALMTLYLFYPMVFTGWVVTTLGHYIPAFPIRDTYSTILIGALILVLGIWAMELRDELKKIENGGTDAHDGISQALRPAAAVLACLAPFIVVPLVVSAVLLGVGADGPFNFNQNPTIKYIDANSTAGQTFISPYNGLYEIGVLFNANTSVNGGDVVFHLRESPSAEDLRRVAVNGSSLKANSLARMAFPPIPDSEGKEYYFFVEAPGSTPQDKVALNYDISNLYADGTAYYDSEPIDGDLEFRTRYKADLTTILPILNGP